MAPELLRGEIDYDPSVDVYAFAILAYEIVTGKEPYYELGPNLTSFLLASKVMSGYRPKFSNDATEKMINLLSRCWSDNASERPSFDEIYSLLSNDFSYFDEPISKEEVNEFIENTLNQLLKNSKYDPNEDFFVALASLHGYKKNKNDAISLLKSSSKKEAHYLHIFLVFYMKVVKLNRTLKKLNFITGNQQNKETQMLCKDLVIVILLGQELKLIIPKHLNAIKSLLNLEIHEHCAI